MKAIFSLAMLFASLAVSAAKIEIGQDHADALYRAGEQTVFTVSVKDGSGDLLKSGKAKW